MPKLASHGRTEKSYGDLDVHYSAFNSGFLQPDVAAATGMVRSKTQGVVNVAVLKAGTASNAKVSGSVKNLLGQSTALNFKEVKEGQAIYYLAQFPFEQRETLRFTLSVQAADGVPHSFDFNQEFFPDE